MNPGWKLPNENPYEKVGDACRKVWIKRILAVMRPLCAFYKIPLKSQLIGSITSLCSGKGPALDRTRVTGGNRD